MSNQLILKGKILFSPGGLPAPNVLYVISTDDDHDIVCGSTDASGNYTVIANSDDMLLWWTYNPVERLPDQPTYRVYANSSLIPIIGGFGTPPYNIIIPGINHPATIYVEKINYDNDTASGFPYSTTVNGSVEISGELLAVPNVRVDLYITSGAGTGPYDEAWFAAAYTNSSGNFTMHLRNTNQASGYTVRFVTSYNGTQLSSTSDLSYSSISSPVSLTIARTDYNNAVTTSPAAQLILSGNIISQQTYSALQNLTVVVGDATGSYGIVGGASADNNGAFSISISDPTTVGMIMSGIVIPQYKVYRNNTLLFTYNSTYTDENIIQSISNCNNQFVILQVDQVLYDQAAATCTPTSAMITITGTVTNNGIKVPALIVNVYENGFRTKILVATGATDINGNYNISINKNDINNIPVIANKSLRVEVVGSGGTLLVASSDLTQWQDVMQVDLKIPGNYSTTSGFDNLLGAVQQVVGQSTDISTIQVNTTTNTDEFHFVSVATGRSQRSIETLVSAHQYANTLNTNPHFPYALLKSAGSKTNPVLKLNQTQMQTAITGAVANNIIPSQTTTDINNFISSAKAFQVSTLKSAPIKNESFTLNDVFLKIFSGQSDINNFVTAYNAAKNNGQDNATFWTSYQTTYGSTLAQTAKAGLRLAAITGFQPELTNHLLGQVNNGQTHLSTLATWDLSTWQSHISTVCTNNNKLCVPGAIRGTATDVNNTAIQQQYATQIRGIVQNYYPLTALNVQFNAGNLISDGPTRTAVSTFITNNPDFDLRTSSIQDINSTNQNLTGISDVQVLKNGLAPFQRVLRITGGNPDAAINMVSNGHDSAEAISGTSKENFITMHGSILGGTDVAGTVYDRAIKIGYVTAHISQNLYQAAVDYPVNAIGNVFSQNFSDASTDPTLANLFGNTSFCTCDDCMSLYSPAAYLADLLNFIRTNNGDVYNELVRRRGDLINIDLTCKNTNTPMPYVDLVIELLERMAYSNNYTSYVIPGSNPVQHPAAAPASLQTNGTQQQIAAYPEHIYKDSNGNYKDWTDYHYVYDVTLDNALYPDNLPFNLAMEETRSYMQYLGYKRHELMKLFQPPFYSVSLSSNTPPDNTQITNFAIYAEYLGLSQEAATIITGAHPSSSSTWLFYGIQASTTTSSNGIIDPNTGIETILDPPAVLYGLWTDILGGRIDVLLNQARITYKELQKLLSTDFLNPIDPSTGTRDIGITARVGAYTDTCDQKQLCLSLPTTNTTTVVTNFFEKLYRFIRLWKTNKYTINEWDILLRSLNIVNIDNNDFITLGRVIAIADKLNVKPEDLMGWWGYFDLHQYTNYDSSAQEKLPSIYDKLYRSRAVASLDLFPDLSGYAISVSSTNNTVTPYTYTLTNSGSQPVFSITYATDGVLIATLCGIREEDLNALLAFLNISGTSGNLLSLTNISRIYTFSRIAKAIGFSINDLLSVFSLSGYNPPALSSTSTSVTFVNASAANSNGTSCLDALEAILKTLDAVRTSRLSIPEIQYIVLQNDNTGAYSPNTSNIQQFLTALRTDLLKYTIYSDPTGGSSNPITQDQANQLVIANKLLTDITNVIYQHFAKEFAVTSQMIDAIIANSTIQISITGTTPTQYVTKIVPSAIVLLLITAGSTPGTDYTAPFLNAYWDNNPLNKPSSGSPLLSLYNDYQLLFKIYYVAKKVGLQKDEFSYFYANPSMLNFDFSTLPVSTVTSNVSLFNGLLRLSRSIDIRKRFSLIATDFTSFMTNINPFIATTTTRDNWKNILLQNSDWEQSMLDSLVGSNTTINIPDGLLKLNYPNDFSFHNYDNISVILTIADIISACRHTGLNPQTIYNVLYEDLALADSHKIYIAAKGKNSDSAWYDIAKPLRDVLREKQRKALVAYTLANPNQASYFIWKDENDLFSFFFIDVEMKPVMLTSRIKQAISSVQLVIDRWAMGLLYSVQDGDVEVMNGSLVQEWESWRKWYRVWEANREVFLYPENWLEPELRDDKTPFFEDLETELKQNDITADTAEDAIMNYLKSLDEVARLESVGTCDDLATGITYAFSRTYSYPHKYYFRRLQNNVWAGWEYIDMEIKSEHVAPVVWNGRLYLFWLTFATRQNQLPSTTSSLFSTNPDGSQSFSSAYLSNWLYNSNDYIIESSSNNSTVPQKCIQVSLNWSEYKKGKWQKHKIAKESLTIKLNPRLQELISYILTTTDTSIIDPPYLAYIKTITENGQLNIDDLFQSRLCLYPYKDINDVLHLALLFNTELPTPQDEMQGDWQASDCEELLYLNGFSFDNSGHEPIVEPIENAENYENLNVAAPNSTVYKNMRFYSVWNNYLMQPSVYTSNTPKYYEYLTNIAKARNVKSAQSAYNLINSNTDNGLYKLVFQSDLTDMPFLGNFFFEDNKYTFFVRKLKSNDFLVAPTVSAETGIDFSGIQVDANYNNIATATTTSSAQAPNTNAIAVQDSNGGTPPPPSPLYFFQTFAHYNIPAFITALNTGGVDALMSLAIQAPTPSDTINFNTTYSPSSSIYQPYPTSNVDFDYWGAYSCYNWELFFHIPMMVAQRLSENQQFEDAQKWYHYIFNPRNYYAGARKVWNFLPFYNQSGKPIQSVSDIISLISENNQAVLAQVHLWEANPFNPFIVARGRILSFMKGVIMKYIDNLIAWGDQLFSRDTIESINEATQLYILAANILGKRPIEVPERVSSSPKTFNDLANSGTLDEFANARVTIEHYIDIDSGPLKYVDLGPGVPSFVPKMLYFCVSPNDKLYTYWDTIADRLFKIRNSLNISGQAQQLPLFEPPIDPLLLIRARAAGIDISSVLDMVSGVGQPIYRFNTMLQKANEFCADVKALGGALLSALEKKDSEDLALLRSGQEYAVLQGMLQMKQSQLDEANTNLDALNKTREVTQGRYDYYNSRPYMNDKEIASISLLTTGTILQAISGAIASAGSTLSAFPTLHFQGLSSGVSDGGLNYANVFQGISTAIGIAAQISNASGSMAATMGGYDRRMDDWQFQAQSASKELEQIDQQILAAQIRIAIAENDLENQQLQIDNNRATDDFIRTKFTSSDLYNWLIGQVSATYFQAYKLAYETARKAGMCYDNELPLASIPSTRIITFGYWDSLRKGLLSGEQLQYDLRRLETLYLENNTRLLELTKHISLSMVDPVNLLNLKQNGSCSISLTEMLFDLDYPTHYNRRIKSVSISIPCVAGPYTTIPCTLILNPGTSYVRTTPSVTTTTMQPATSSIATSSAQNDSGMFEFNFRDERYLPFEGSGVISQWSLKLGGVSAYPLFDYNTISDVILHIKYTALDGGTLYDRSSSIQTALTSSNANMPRIFSLKHEFASQWYAYVSAVANSVSNPRFNLALNHDMFPFFCKGKDVAIAQVYMQAKLKSTGGGSSITVTDTNTSNSSSINITLTDSVLSSADTVNLTVAQTTALSLSLKIQDSTNADVNLDAVLDDLYLVTTYNFGNNSGGQGGSLLLDLYTGASVAFSLRQIKTGATKCIRVRRASDNTEQDIAFVSGYLDTASLATFINGTTGYITKWYDQSGNGNDAYQTTAANQPQVLLGVVGTNAAIVFTSSASQKLLLTSTITLQNGVSNLNVIKKNATSDFMEMLGNTTNTTVYSEYKNDGSIWFSIGTGNTSVGYEVSGSSPSNNTNLQLIGAFAGVSGQSLGNKQAYQNSVQVSTFSDSSSLPKSVYDCLGCGENYYCTGNVFEVLLWPGYNANETSIVSNIKTYYGL